MNRFKIYLTFTLLLLPLIFLTLPTATAEENIVEDINGDGVFNIRIEASQWEFKAFNIDDRTDPINDARAGSKEMKHSLHFPKGSDNKLVIELVSRDVQHGFSVNEWNLAVALNRQNPGEEFGDPTLTQEIDMPNEDITYSAFCHIFCGLGHPDMKIKFVFGEGSPNVGLWVFWGAIGINATAFGLTLRSVLTKLALMG